ncbi:MAG: MBL fold metallo-hydrolase [Blastochloris sp.]|nr:MBL fold metallo-hydrolase [Blastochloris sp.]
MSEDSFRFTILASGSSGNCALLEIGSEAFLVDAGLSGKKIGERLESLGRSLEEIRAVFLTHEHSDHTLGLPVLARRRKIPVYCNEATARALQGELGDYEGWRFFETGSSFQVGSLSVVTFPVPHDAYEPVGFTFSNGKRTVGFLTDLGFATKLVVERVRQADVLVLEANHDLELLKLDQKRPWSVKQRILARHGHLSNEAAAEVVGQIVTQKLTDLFLGHLSEDCNSHELAEAAVQRKFNEMGVTHVRIHRTYSTQATPSLLL